MLNNSFIKPPNKPLGKPLSEIFTDIEPSSIPLVKPPVIEDIVYNFHEKLKEYIQKTDNTQTDNIKFGYNLGKFSPYIQNNKIFFEQFFKHFNEIIMKIYEKRNVVNPSLTNGLNSLKASSSVIIDIMEQDKLKDFDKREIICYFTGLILSYLEREMDK